MPDIDLIRQKVQTFLTSEGRIGLEPNGDFSVDYGSTRVFIQVLEHPNGEASIVDIYAPVLIGVPASSELFKYVAVDSDYFFGHLCLEEDGNGTFNMLMVHNLLGDFLDKGELMYAVIGVAGTADDLDEDLVSRFGGSRFEDI